MMHTLKQKYLIFPCLIISLISASYSSYAEDNDSTEVDIEYEVEKKKEDIDRQYFGVEKIFKNPALSSGLSMGINSLNQSIDNLMETIFYRLLSNELVYNVNDLTQFSVSLKRDLY
ncbi:MAG: hypothetical protein HQK54_12010, partial [Oligoflexales bacterium]|nr:hypothetical protein [Oligoflexales bacterium]